MSKLIRRIAGLAGAVAIATATFIAPAQAAEVDLYTTPGGHVVNERIWNTTCEKYSSTVFRCRTDIWASVVQNQGGKLVNVTGWQFNNLTYLPSERAQWAKNPLGKTGEFVSQDRLWKTDCDSPATGKGGCRSYIWTDYVAMENGKPVPKTGFVFNSMVRFAEGPIAPVTTMPKHVLDQVQLTFSGLGPLHTTANHQTDLANWERLGYIKQTPEGDCYAYETTNVLDSRGIDPINGTYDVAVTKPGIKTEAGAEVGMTVAQLKAIYGSKFEIVQKTNYGVQQYFGSVRNGDRELLFRVQGAPDGHGGFDYAPVRPLVDTDKIIEMAAQPFMTDVSFDGC